VGEGVERGKGVKEEGESGTRASGWERGKEEWERRTSGRFDS